MHTKKDMTIGYLPTIDHLILGVAAHNDRMLFEKKDIQTKQYTDWIPFSEDLRTGKIGGAFLLFPLAFDLFRNGFKGKLVLLGHREGQVLVARKGIEDVKDLKGKAVFVPHKYATHHILLHLALKQAGLTLADVKLSTGFHHPREMVDMLKTGKVAAFVAAEPMGSEAVQEGVGNILKLSNDISPHHADCVLVVSDAFISQDQETAYELVESLVKAGLAINAYPRQAAEIGEQFLGWPKKVLLRSLTHSKAHILFWDLLPRVEDFVELERVAVNEMHLWDKVLDIDKFIDPRFAQKAYREWVIGTRQQVKDRGAKRTLPGDFAEAAGQFGDMFGDKVIVVGQKFVQAGNKYPKGLPRVDGSSEDQARIFERVFSGERLALETKSGEHKALTFIGPEDSPEPDRVLFRLPQDDALRVLQAVNWGDRIGGIEQYDELEARSDFFLPAKNISILKKGSSVYFSLNAEIFKFLVLLLQNF